jgi:4-amino-4-deoxy-L-arabinose transferase-like glycosyltransferase
MPLRGAAFLVVLALWLSALAAVGIRGEFPLSDDWAYAHVVRSLVEGRGFDFLPWTGASLVFQALYGAAVSKLAGFSYETLRLTTLVVSAAGIASTYGLLREMGAESPAAAAGAATVALSPLWFNLSLTFMTDVPFAAVATISAWLYARAFRRDSRTGLLAAGVVAAAAFLIRQHGVWIAGAAALAAIAVRPRSNDGIRSRMLDVAAALVMPIAAVAAYSLWVLTSAVVPLALHNKIDEAAGVSALTIANAAFRGVATVGFLLLPWAAALGAGRGRQQRDIASTRQWRVFASAFVVLLAVAVFLYVREGATMFYLSNMLGDFWIGPMTTRDVQFLAHRPVPDAGLLFHVGLTVVSLASAAALIAGTAAPLGTAPPLGTAAPAKDAPALQREDHRRGVVFCVLALVLSALGSLAQAHYFFDRYLIVLMPLAMATTVALSPPLRIGPAFASTLAILSIYAIAGTHDYMEWNRARWGLLAGLESRGITARSIDGGVEYNGERLAAELRTSPTDVEARRGQPESRKSWWWVVDDEWIVALSPLDGYREEDFRTFTRWLPPGEGRVLVLRRNSSNRNPS